MSIPDTPLRGPLRRHEFVRLGVTGPAGLAWPGLPLQRAVAESRSDPRVGRRGPSGGKERR